MFLFVVDLVLAICGALLPQFVAGGQLVVQPVTHERLFLREERLEMRMFQCRPDLRITVATNRIQVAPQRS